MIDEEKADKTIKVLDKNRWLWLNGKSVIVKSGFDAHKYDLQFRLMAGYFAHNEEITFESWTATISRLYRFTLIEPSLFITIWDWFCVNVPF